LYYFKDLSRKEIHSLNENEYRELIVQFWYPTEKKEEKALIPYLGDTMPFVKEALKEWYLYYLPSSIFDYLLKGIYTHAVPNLPVSHLKEIYPVIIFSHGFACLSNFNTTQLEELASHGYVVVGINHTRDCSVSVFPDGRVVPLNEKWKEHYVGYLSKAIDWWVQDVRFVLNKLAEINKNDPEKKFTGKLDLSRIGIFGHSMGGATATQICRSDDRVKAGINMDGPLFGKKPTKSFAKPFMFMLAEEPLKKLEKPLTEKELEYLWLKREDERLLREIYAAGIPILCSNIGKDVYYLVIRGAEHYTFSDFPLIRKLSWFFRYFNLKTGTLDPYRAIEITNNYVLQFFDKYLKEKESPLFDGNKYYPEVVLKMWGPTVKLMKN